ncbi:LytTR family DNA-binding domain-containing protein [Segetibacter sp.]|jgi:DNA-binding LytR/AlgR family response regulator|uniref:LytR/AlgR family response regulator transcription factor n=1 Tax=Segetibacter sp. TaxID=2231182 RepID=UPI0026142CFB|nr:LytTR family DNA-binding domain-containing protein [Segetibacter sp.]MCW3080245.1 two-component system response regulator [Segetibacter sp.]
MRCIAIDDEPLALQLITEYASRIPFLSLEKTFTNPDEGREWLQQHEADLLFLDIQMPDINGLQFYKTLVKKPMVVFTTAYSEYAVDGFNVDAVDYLLKPFEYDRFLKAVFKAREYLEFLNSQELQMASIFVKVDYQLMKINLKEIELIEGLDDYIRIHLKPKPILTLMTLKSLQEKLPTPEFVRIHRSYIVPSNKIESFGKSKVKVAGKEIPVGSSYSEVYQQLLKSKGLEP